MMTNTLAVKRLDSSRPEHGLCPETILPSKPHLAKNPFPSPPPSSSSAPGCSGLSASLGDDRFTSFPFIKRATGSKMFGALG